MKSRNAPFEKFAYKATVFSGSTLAFMMALLAIVMWLISGKYFSFSDTWQLVINTGTTIITFLMVFLIQRMQNKDSKAIHLKLNELVAALNGPSNRLIDIEDLTEGELETLSNYYKKLAEMAKHERLLSRSHSIEEAIKSHRSKYNKAK
ncbi:MAG TPA: low affinity iron permease family protein [Bacteroidia bacterium]